MQSGILLVFLDLVHHIHGLEDDCRFGLVSGVQEEVGHLPLQDVEVVQLEYPWSLEDKHFH